MKFTVKCPSLARGGAGDAAARKAQNLLQQENKILMNPLKPGIKKLLSAGMNGYYTEQLTME